MAKHPEDYIVGKTGLHSKYDQSQTLKSYQTSDSQFPNPKGEVVFEGFGANKTDLERGFCDPNIQELPNYDKANYYDRYSQPKNVDEEQGNHMSLPKDMEFRMKERESKGFLTRSHIPTER